MGHALFRSSVAVLALVFFDDADATPQTPERAARATIVNAEVAADVREAMATVLRQHPSETRWSGRAGSDLFAMAVLRLPDGELRQRSIPAMLEAAHIAAVQEVLRAKALLDRFATTGLTDSTTLRKAVESCAGSLQVAGNVEGVVSGATVQGEYATAYVVAEQPTLTAHLLSPTQLQKVRNAYRDVMHSQARELMARSNWSDAILLWHHLHQRGIISQQLYVDAASCFQQLGQGPDAIRVISEAIDVFDQSGTAEFFEQAGDIALAVHTEAGDNLAAQAYRKAIDTLRNTVSGMVSRARTLHLGKGQ